MICVNSINVYPESVTLQKENWYYGVTATLCPVNAACRSVTWHSSNPAVAGVNASSGYIYANAAGTARIYATATDGSGCSDYITVTVTETVSVDSVTLNKSRAVIEVCGSIALSATVSPENATNRAVNWSGNHSNIATVNSDGVVSGVASGIARITATAADGSGKSASCVVRVTTDTLVNSVTVTPSTKTMFVGNSMFLSATVCPTNATRKSVCWSSSDTDIVTVNPDTGLIMAQKEGMAHVYAKACDGSDCVGCCCITVEKPIPVADITGIPESLNLKFGEFEKFTAMVSPANAANKKIRWQSSNTNVATVDNNGTVIAVSEGNAVITASAKDGSGVSKACNVEVNPTTVKNYNVGQIRLDLPTSNYIHELPLLSFSDIHGGVNLSLIFNYKMKAEDENPYNIAAGYQLNSQKRLIFSGGVPTKIQNEFGKKIALNPTAFSNVYVLDDDSQRVLRKINATYELENGDFSKELYNAEGKITGTQDKYGEAVLSYDYNSFGQLTSMTYRGSKTITFIYDSANCLSQIMYGNKLIKVAYDSNVQITHYTGVTFTLTSSGWNYTAAAIGAENSTVVLYTAKVESTDNTLRVYYSVGDDVTDSTLYQFPYAVNYDTSFDRVETITKQGVKTVIQYQNGSSWCSYELPADASDITFGEGGVFTGNVNVFDTLDDLKNVSAQGVYTLDDGICMHRDAGGSTWSFDDSSGYDNSVGGYYVLTGWGKNEVSATDLDYITVKNNDVPVAQFDLNLHPTGKWQFFAYKFTAGHNVTEVECSTHEVTDLKDLRLHFIPTYTTETDTGKHIPLSEDVLIGQGTSENIFIPISEATFTYGSTNAVVEQPLFFDDILKYKLNRKKNVNTNELYADHCKEILNIGTEGLKVLHGNYTHDVDSLNLAKRRYSTNGTVTTVFKDDGTDFLVCDMICKLKDANDDATISSQTYDSYMDVTESTQDGVTTAYTRNQGLITSESVTGLHNKQYIYSTDESGQPTVGVVDELGKATVYTVDSVWGNVQTVKLPNGQVINYEYDGSTGTQLSIGLESDSQTLYGYFGGNLSQFVRDGLSYNFAYSKGNLSLVTKKSMSIEEHTTEDIMLNGEHYTKIQSNYPSQTNPLYTDTVIYDKYGRLEKIEGVLTNEYGSRAYTENDYCDQYYPADATVCKLMCSTDHITGKKRKFAYLNDKLYKIGEFDESNTKLAEEVWQYDAADRPTTLTYTTDGCNVEENITYTTEADSAAPTNRISSYTYTVANKGCANVNNTYDKFHRVTAKAVTVGGNNISKEYIYEYTRLDGMSHTVGSTQIHNYMLGYDSLSRITSETDSKASDYTNTYVYDAYGQLVRENNKRLGKTILYTYDNIGNITRVQEYDYTTDDEVSGTPIEDIYTYDSTYPDCLKTFNGRQITYDANGRVATYDGWTYTWERDKLKSIEKSNSTDDVPPKYTFTYNAYGERLSKVYTNVKSLTEQSNYITNSTTNYKYDLCGRLIKENRTLQYSKTGSVTKELTYLYEGSEIIGLVYTTADGASTYYYDKNVYGDVISILDNAGNTVVKYKYDAYGNCEYYDSVNTDLAETNPIRYRSYYYDVETGLYYLQTRYYNPEWRRFISPDSTSYLEPETPTGLNLYCYCGNDPVNNYDPTGHFTLPNWAKWVIGGVAFAGAVALTVVTGGALAPVLVGMAGGILLDGVVEGVISSANGESFWEGFADGAANGAMWGGIFALGGAALRTIKMFKNGVAIGENMNRVNNLAKAGHQITYKGMPGFKFVKIFGGDDLARTLFIRHNQTFIERMMKWGVEIVDFGIDTSRNYRSFYYLMETIVSNGYGLLQLMY